MPGARIKPSNVRQATHLQNFVLAHQAERYMDDMLTFISTVNESNKYWMHEPFGRRREAGLKRADGSKAVRVDLRITEDTFDVEEYAMETLFGPRVLAEQDGALGLLRYAGTAHDKTITLERSYQAYTIYTTDANYATGHSTALTDELDDYVNGDPKGAAQTALDRLYTSVGGKPVGCRIKACMPVGVVNALTEHPDVKESVKHVGGVSERGRTATWEELARYLEVDDIVVPREVLDTSVSYPDAMDEAQNASRMWADTVDKLVFAFVADSPPSGTAPDMANGTAVGAFRKGSTENMVEQYDPGPEYASQGRAAQVVRVSNFFALKKVGVDDPTSAKMVYAHIVTNCLT